jgi:hypothetical protein
VTTEVRHKHHRLGKGAAYDIGSSLKHTVSMGADISTPRQLFDALCSTGSSIKQFYVSSEDVDVAVQNEPVRLV